MKKIILLLTLISTNIYADLQAAITAYQQGHNDTAKVLFSEALEQVEAKIYLARIWQNQDLDAAEQWIEQALEQDPDNPLAHFVKGSVMANQASDSSIFSAYGYAKASLAGFKKAVALAPEQVRFRQGLMQFYLQAPGIAGGSEEQAWQQVEEIERLSPLDGIKARLAFYKETKNSEEYELLLFKARQTYRDKADFHYLAALDLQSKKRYSEALELFERASLLPGEDTGAELDNYQSLYQVGRTAVLAQDFIEKGIQALERYLQQAPDSRQLPQKYWARFRLANLLELKGENNEAQQIYQNLLAIDDKLLHERVKKALQQS
ncbi:hypothetical protein [Lacimicrobium sp. SS2-24]|uniref:tetratricopeptide repeat protein n=1 Tax=Lacimicrobium sp. SS2-24 TaxID=2005569 RepID=UPI000B4BF010|nr:hypothetical protein [Lacimicrobium sp. SS2-24]